MARIEIPEGEGHEVSRVWSIAPHMGKGAVSYTHLTLPTIRLV